MTLKRIYQCYDAHLLSTWDHTSVIASQLHNLHITTHNTWATKKLTNYRSPQHFNPYRKQENRSGTKITPANIGILKMVGNAFMRGK